MTALSVAIPCFNEAEGLPELHRRVTAACRGGVSGDYEIVLVNDGSTDTTWEVIRSLAAQDSQVVGINLSRNHGHQLALSAALSYCRGARILILDADLQDPPELLPEMMRSMDQGADVVYGQRRSRTGETRTKRFTAALFYRLLDKLTDVPIPKDTGDFRLMSRRVLDVLQNMPERQRFTRGMIAWIGFSQVPLLYDRAPRFAGQTNYPIRRMITFAFDAITSFSVRPLRVGLYLGSFMCGLALLLVVATLVWWIVFTPFPGWASLMIVFLLIGGVQTILLGLIGEYLSRLYLESKRRPLFIVSEVLNADRQL
jgi:polyisoprenyl-phosphate glycosyltransferase